MKHRLVLATMAAMFFTAQTEAQQQRSEALEITRATALRGALRDVPREHLEEAIRSSSDMTVNYALDAVGVATGVFDQATSLSRLGETGVFAALAFFAPTSKQETWPAIFGWMPREYAPTPKDATAVFQGTVLAALKLSLPEYALSVVPHPSIKAFENIHIDGPDCAPCEFRAQLWATANPAKVRAPEILGRYPAYRWGGAQASGWVAGFPLIEGLTIEDRLVFYQTLSRHLPAWAYIYLPPHDMLLDFPLMFNEGEALYFIEPAAAEDG